jgi:hypothetical protein
VSSAGPTIARRTFRCLGFVWSEGEFVRGKARLSKCEKWAPGLRERRRLKIPMGAIEASTDAKLGGVATILGGSAAGRCRHDLRDCLAGG